MIAFGEQSRDVGSLAVPLAGELVATGACEEPYRLLDPSGGVVEPVTAYLRDLEAAGRSVATLRSYGMDLLRWFRFLWAVEVAWDRASRIEARDFSSWLRMAGKQTRVHWRHRGQREPETDDHAGSASSPSAVHAVTGKPLPGKGYAASTIAHSETVLRAFYEFHAQVCSGPVINPFPLVRTRRAGRANAHHNPMEPFRNERAGLYRPRVPQRVPRSIPDEVFNELFARLPSHRDRALVAFFVSTGARAAELLGVTQGGVDPGKGVISVVRKGSRVVQQLPASSDAFVWLRLYQVEVRGRVSQGHRQPLWWTLRRPYRPLTYHALHRMFERVNDALGANWTLHDLRHTAAYRMAEDPGLALADVQHVLGHAHLTTTQIYLTPRQEDVIRRVLDHHEARKSRQQAAAIPPPAPGYRPESLDVLFGRHR